MTCMVAERMKQLLWVQGPEIMALWLKVIYLLLRFRSEASRLPIRQQGLDSPERLRVPTDKNVDDICNDMRKPGSKNANETPNRGQQISVISQENLKLVFSLFHHQLRCTFDWKVMEVCEETGCLLAGQKRLKDKYKDPDMLT